MVTSGHEPPLWPVGIYNARMLERWPWSRWIRSEGPSEGVGSLVASVTLDRECRTTHSLRALK